MYKYILAIDPSGAFDEGEGTTGWCLYDAIENKIKFTGTLSAAHYKKPEEFWLAHLELIAATVKQYKETTIILEDYLLYADKAKQQINSKFETSQLIGNIKIECYRHDIPLHMQTAIQVKNRWTNNILEHKNIICKGPRKQYYVPGTNKAICRHELDAIRHAVHYNTFYNK